MWLTIHDIILILDLLGDREETEDGLTGPELRLRAKCLEFLQIAKEAG